MDKKNPFEEKKEDDVLNEEKQQPDEEQKDNSNEDKKENKSDDNNSDEQEVKTDEVQKKYDELNNKYIRLAADFDNFRKRTAQERQDLLKYGAAEVLGKFISVLDNFERANKSLKDIEDASKIKEGYEVVYRQIIETFKKAGVEEIDALGKEFNPAEHEAVTQIPTDEFEPNQVAAILQKGYKLYDKVLRPVMVGVAKEKEND